MTPPYHSGVDEIAGRWIPLGLVHLAGAARQAGLQAEIYDAMTLGHGYGEVEHRLAGSRYEYAAATAMTATADDALKTLALAKAVSPDAVTILGGLHPTFMYRDIFEQSSAIDYIVMGEGEATLRHLLEVLQAGGDPASVPGLAFRGKDGAVIVTPGRPLLRDLDDLPAAWDLLEWDHYTYLPIPGSRLGAISTSRGCAHDCRFCSQQPFWGKTWRAREPGRAAAELEHLHRTYGVNVFLLADEHPTRDRGRWEAFLDALIARNLPVHILMETRAPDILRDRDIMGKYRTAGIIYVSLGVETADRETLAAMGKGMTGEEIKPAFDVLREQEIVSEASFILGFPDETPESIKQTMQTVQDYNPDIANFFTYTPWPYVARHAEDRELIRCRDYGRFNLVDAVLEPRGMSILQVEVAVADCYRRFYMGKMIDYMTMKAGFRRDYLMRITKLFMSSTFVLKKLRIGIFGMIPAKVAEIRRGKG